MHLFTGVPRREKAGLREAQTRVISAPLRMASAAECVRFERESFGALHQMLSGLNDVEKEAAWAEIEQELQKFEGSNGPCELVVGSGIR